VELEIARRLVPAFLVPNLKFNQAITGERKEKAAHDVPLIKGYVKQNERIIDSHEIVTEEVYQKLQSLSLALQERAAARTGWAQLKFAAGKYLFAVILLVLALLYLYFYRKSLFDNNLLLGMVTLIFLLQLAGAAVITRLLELSPLAIPLLLAPMLLSILLDFGVAFIFTVTLSLILGASLSNDYTFTFMMLVVGSVAVFSVQKIRNRGHMFRAILFILLAYLVVHVIFGLLHFEPMKKLLVDFTIYLVPNAILVPTIVYLLIGIFERVFDVTTDISLLELSDLNHPLLKQLSVKAPGTFHHSIMVANLAEAAAEAIKANALLTRVGAYFHDVGKMFKPEYFIENQMGGVNKHDSLTPHMSCLILANHVKAGLELADKHNLPRSVKQFIAEHHGTSLMTFFYHKAVENGDSKEINENDFRYPGPKPQSKETAILMLADSVEAASRTLQNPTPQRIRNLVNTLVENKIKEGQLDECNLTLQEIREIKEAFIPILTGIHHLRIEYPAEALDRDKRGEREKRPVENRGERTVKTGPVPQPTPSTGKKTDTETGKEEYGYGS
ncbi:MAG: HDIG domain-containing protein, partial [Calditrichaeota bacterium]